MVTKSQALKFIKSIAPYVQELAPKYNIKCCSAIIAQACLESAYGTSSKAKFNNFFGLKYRKGRVNCNNGYFRADSLEQHKDGSYTPISTDWYSFEDMRHGVEGYLQFINISTYKNLKGVKDPEKYLTLIKKDGYATSLKYVENVMKVVKSYDLTKYDK